MISDLIYTEFEQYEVERERTRQFEADEEKWYGTRAYIHRFRFENGYGASVIKHGRSYGYIHNLFEVGFLDTGGELVYYEPFGDSVKGFLTNDEVLEILEEIKRLK
ncbi:MAG TPA: hypothetical protein PLI61_13830 [bacterium]|nr:hypothetical protein [bacterium]